MLHEIIQFNPIDDPSRNAFALMRNDISDKYYVIEISSDGNQFECMATDSLPEALNSMALHMGKSGLYAEWVVNY